MRQHSFFLTFSNLENSTLQFFKKNFSLYNKLIQYLLAVLSNHLTKIAICDYDLILYVKPNSLRYVISFLKLHSFSKVNSITDIAVVDFPGKSLRFEINYQLLSISFNSRLRVIVETNEILPVVSITSIFAGANWYEREVWDMFGIFFQEHPDLRRILTDYGFKGHPLRKDFPLSGYIEVFYDDTKKSIVYVPVSLAQDFRNFNFKNPWVKQ